MTLESKGLLTEAAFGLIIMTCSNIVGVDGIRASLISCGYGVDNFFFELMPTYPQLVHSGAPTTVSYPQLTHRVMHRLYTANSKLSTSYTP